MTDKDGQQNSSKLNLNLGAKSFVPKSYGNNNMTNTNPNTNLNTGQGYNPYYNPMMMNNMGGMGMNYNPNMMMGNNQGFNPYVVDVNSQLNQGVNKINTDTSNTLIPQQTNKLDKVEKVVEPKKQILTNPNNKEVGKDTKKPNQNQNNQPKKDEKKPEKKVEQKKDEKKVEKKEEKKPEEKKQEDTQIEKLGEIELVDDSKEGKMIEVDETKLPVTIVFIGHVDHGKSTLSGQILISTGMVDERTIEKYQKEAKAKKRESWYIAYILDSNEDERERGKTVEIGKAFFKTPNRRFTILDAPGHSDYLPNMLQGACQADIAGLVVSAKGGEFEAGFEKSGSTREHVLLAKSLGVSKLIVLVNKMDEDSVKWSEKRFNQIKSDLSEYLKKLGYDLEKDVSFIPISGLLGDNIKNRADPHKCKWYEGPTVLELLDTTEPPQRDRAGPLRISILDRYREGGMQIMGKVESGTLKFGSVYTIMPSKVNIEISWIFNSEDDGVPYALPGESVRLKIKGTDNDNEVNRGYILCSPDNLCGAFNQIIAEIIVLEFPEKLSIIGNGFKCTMHYHTAIEEVELTIMAEINKKREENTKVKFIKSNTRAKVLLKTNNLVCGEKFDVCPTLGRFTLRYASTTIAVGKILKYKLSN